MGGTSLVLAEREPEDRSFLERHLRTDGFDVVGVAAAGEALDATARACPDLVLLGNPLADASALDVCAQIRCRDDRLPVIVLDGGAADAVDRVRAFDRGCDDWLARPFDYEELLARIRAVLRRRSPEALDTAVVVGALTIDPATRRVTSQGREVKVGATEFRLLHFLMTHPERVHSRAQLLDRVWGDHVFIEERTVDVHVKRLRESLSSVSCQHMIETVRGAGYRLTDAQAATA